MQVFILNQKSFLGCTKAVFSSGYLELLSKEKTLRSAYTGVAVYAKIRHQQANTVYLVAVFPQICLFYFQRDVDFFKQEAVYGEACTYLCSYLLGFLSELFPKMRGQQGILWGLCFVCRFGQQVYLCLRKRQQAYLQILMLPIVVPVYLLYVKLRNPGHIALLVLVLEATQGTSRRFFVEQEIFYLYLHLAVGGGHFIILQMQIGFFHQKPLDGKRIFGCRYEAKKDTACEYFALLYLMGGLLFPCFQESLQALQM